MFKIVMGLKKKALKCKILLWHVCMCNNTLIIVTVKNIFHCTYY